MWFQLMGESTKAPRTLVLFGFLGDHRNHPTAGRARIEVTRSCAGKVDGMTNVNHTMTTERSAHRAFLLEFAFLLDGGFVKFLQKTALLNLLQETEVGNIGGLQHSGFRIVFTIQDRLNRLFHR